MTVTRSWRVLAIIVDYHTSPDAEALSVQLTESQIDKKSFELKTIHVDNGNEPPAKLSPRQKNLEIEILSTNSNLGYAGALNFAIQDQRNKEKKYDAYWFLNADLETESTCLSKLVAVLQNSPRVGAVGPIVRDASRRTHVWGARGTISPWLGTTAMTNWPQGGILPKWSYIPGCSLLVRAAAFEEIGKLPERYKLYFEETEFCVKLQRAGWDLWVEHTAEVYHKVDSMKGRIPARHFAYYFIRNNLIFWKTCFGIPIWIQLPRTIYVMCREVLFPLRRAKNGREVLDRVKYAIGGLVDGILLATQRPLWFERKLFR